jgi:prepilin signal peptidase PulO-like enzyme (type II secretory pathway)
MLEIILITICGAIFGSYATLFAYRLPLNESLFGRYFGPKSRCPNCNIVIKTRHLIPLINWLITLGKCANCKNKISLTHLFTELTTTISFIICYLKFGFSELFILNTLFCTCLVIITTTDYSHNIFPDKILAFMACIAAIIRTLSQQSINEMIFTIALSIIFIAIFYRIFLVKNKIDINIKNNYSSIRQEIILLGQNLSHQQLEGYCKIIIISAILLPIINFIQYFIVIIVIFILFIGINKMPFYSNIQNKIQQNSKSLNNKNDLPNKRIYYFGYILTLTLFIIIMIGE